MYCLREGHIASRCSIYLSFPARTREGLALRLKKHLMEVTMVPQSDPGWVAPTIHHSEQSRSAPPITESQSRSVSTSTMDPCQGLTMKHRSMCISMAVSVSPDPRKRLYCPQVPVMKEGYVPWLTRVRSHIIHQIHWSRSLNCTPLLIGTEAGLLTGPGSIHGLGAINTEENRMCSCASWIG